VPIIAGSAPKGKTTIDVLAPLSWAAGFSLFGEAVKPSRRLSARFAITGRLDFQEIARSLLDNVVKAGEADDL
jgi:hypothetical protein